MRRAATGAAAACVLSASAAGAQAVGGRVVEAATRRPLAGVAVRLLRVAPGDSAAPAPTAAAPADTAAVAADTTSAEGAFVLMAPGVGRYRVRIGDAYLGPPLALAAVDSMDQREYQVAAAPAAEPAAPGAELLGGAARVYDESEVEQKARLLPRSAPPVDMRGVADGAAPAPGRARWRAVVEAVVGPDGRAEPASVRAVSATTPEFGTAAERHVRGARFVPAQVAGAPVRQRVRVPVDVMSVTRVEVRRF